MENKKFNVGDKVRFDDGDQNGVGIIVAIAYDDRNPFLVNSKDILNGHDGRAMDYIQDNEHNWWFKEEQLVPFVEEEENNEEIDYKKELLSLKIESALNNYQIKEWIIYKGFVTLENNYNNTILFDFLDELKSLGYTIKEIIAEYEKQKGTKIDNEQTK